MRSINPNQLELGLPHAQRTLIGSLVPHAASAETYADLPERTMHSSEAARVAGATPARRREFATVRGCARHALQRIGVSAAPILPDSDRAPLWPEGVVGSMTHCDGYRAAAVARSDDLGGIGIDAEPHGPLTPETRELILRREERSALRVLAAARPELRWDRIAFCVKEAVFKAWFPLTRHQVDFTDVAVAIGLDRTFEARVFVPRTHSRDGRSTTFRGRWVVRGGLVVAAASIEPVAAERLETAREESQEERA